MKYKIESYGLELEYADIDTRKKLPSGLSWDYKDFSICNSNGLANDPKKKMNFFGSEVHTQPMQDPGQVEMLTRRFIGTFPEAKLNYTTNLHVHIRVPGLRNDLDALKRLETYYHKHGPEMFKAIQPLERPKRGDFELDKQFIGALRRYRRRLRSHQEIVDDNTYDRIMKAKTVDDFHDAFYRHDSKGQPLRHLFQREGVNLAHLFRETETIEFRHFTMTRYSDRLLTALWWVKAYFVAALYSEEGPLELYNRFVRTAPFEVQFQSFFKYNYSLDKIFRKTSFKHPRTLVEKEYERLIAKGVIKKRDVNI